VAAEAPAYIDGEAYAPGHWYETIDPTTEKPIAAVADCGAAEVDAAARAAAVAAPSWAALPAGRRAEALGHAARSLAEQRAELIDLAIADTGARRAVAAATQVDAAIARLAEWSRQPAALLALPSPPAPPDGPGVRTRVRRVPVGVVGCISPYNFPLLAMVGKAAPALFAGNAVLLKPAPQDPLLVTALAQALIDGVRRVGAPAGVVNLITGAGAQAGAAVVAHPAVSAVSFTGSTVVGQQISRDAAPALKPLLLELGGKGAVIVRADADPRDVAEAVARTWTIQSGQVCLTPARLLADDAVHDDLVRELRAILDGLRLGDPRDPDVTVGPLISAAQRDKVAALTARARDEGCEVIEAGQVPGTGYFAPPALVLGCHPDNEIMQEEVFGPVLSVMRTHGDEEAVAAANSTRYALYDYVFSADVARAGELAARLRSAQVGVNTTRRNMAAPFGGNRGSGLGRSGGHYSLDLCTTLQAVTERSNADE
jgi:acyl-CoA reductase-like NAD-dependent aldehyde dehydrogenase